MVKDPSGLKGAPIIRWEGNKDDRDIKLKYMLLMIGKICRVMQQVTAHIRCERTRAPLARTQLR